jgi:uncharacterized protein (DUF58 family)
MATDLIEYLDPRALSRVESLELIAKFIVEGFMTGLHRSPYHGFSVEFSSYRRYAPGDDLKFIDWRVFGRLDKHYVKQFEETTNLNAWLVLDASGSMSFESSGVSKWRYACFVAAALAYLMLKQRDAVGLALVRDGRLEVLPASSKTTRMAEVLAILDRARPAGESAVGALLHTVVEQVRRRGLLVVVSDFFQELPDIESALRFARYRNHEVLAFQVLTDVEHDFPYTVQTNFVDSETGERVVSEPRAVRSEYLRLLRAHNDGLRHLCEECETDLVSLKTADSLAEALTVYLSHRMQRM